MRAAETAETIVAPRENPLVSFALMKRLYTGMVETRLLEAYVAKWLAGGKRSAVQGEEACRAAVLLNLETGDLVANDRGRAGSAWLRGAELAEIVSGVTKGLLPSLKDVSQQLAMVLGAASVVKRAELPHVAIVFLEARTKRSALHPILTLAAREELPILFVMLPAEEQSSAKSVAAEATRLSVPGIPVEAHDAVALCRVAQESLLRARAGGGPALIECVLLERGKRAPDPIAAMGKTLLRVGACEKAWLDGVAPAFRARLKASNHERRA